MPLQQVCNVNFGSSRSNATGSTGVGYALLNYQGVTVSPRTTLGVYQLLLGSGLYAAYVTFPDNFHGQVLWDTGEAFPTASYAIEEFNVEANNPRVGDVWEMINVMTGSVQSMFDITYGRWKIDKVTNRLLCYKPDNVTLLAQFELLDDQGNLTYMSASERRRI